VQSIFDMQMSLSGHVMCEVSHTCLGGNFKLCLQPHPPLKLFLQGQFAATLDHSILGTAN